jgi:serine/threonine protein kinase
MIDTPSNFTLSDVTNFNLIGTGSYSEVYSAIYKNTGTNVAIKIFTIIPDPDDLQAQTYLSSEIQIHRDLEHPHIAQYFGQFNDGELHGIVLELVEGELLLDHVISCGPLDEHEAQNLFLQIVNAVHYLHVTKSIVHRDLKLENILLTCSGNVKLIDFGFAYRANCPAHEQWTSEGYGAPEILLGLPYSQAIDLYSLGVVF